MCLINIVVYLDCESVEVSNVILFYLFHGSDWESENLRKKRKISGRTSMHVSIVCKQHILTQINGIEETLRVFLFFNDTKNDNFYFIMLKNFDTQL